MLNKKILGLTLVILSITQLILFSIVINQTKESILSKLISEEEGICEHIGDECPHEQISLLNTLTIIIYITTTLIFIIGIILIIPKRKQKKIRYDIPKNLSEEENKIINILKENDGSIFQSDLVEKTEFSKVKITRILDVLEGKKVIERKRRGMTNIVILKA